VKALRMKRGLEAVANLSSVLPASSPLRREAQVGLLCCRSYGHAKAWGKGQGLEAVANLSSVLPPRPSLAFLQLSFLSCSKFYHKLISASVVCCTVSLF